MKQVFYHNWVPLVALIALTSFSAAEGAAQKPSLELSDVKQSATASSISLAGEVKNVSSGDVSGVTVYCDFLGAGGKIVRTEQTTLEPDPLSPNKVATFKCSTKASPEIKGYNFRFDRMFGGPLVVKPAPKK